MKSIKGIAERGKMVGKDSIFIPVVITFSPVVETMSVDVEAMSVDVEAMSVDVEAMSVDVETMSSEVKTMSTVIVAMPTVVVAFSVKNSPVFLWRQAFTRYFPLSDKFWGSFEMNNLIKIKVIN